MGQFEELNKAIELSDSQKYTIKTLEKEVKELKMVYDIVIYDLNIFPNILKNYRR